MAFTIRAPRPRNPRRQSASWEAELRKECYWQNELSFYKLKSQSLIRNYKEWKSIYDAFRDRNISSSKHIISWLRNQNGLFRKSYLHYVLITGYSRESNVSLFNINVIPNEIQDIILFYANLIFIKLYENEPKSDDSKPMIRAFDCNFTVNNLGAILAKNEINSSDLRLWTHFDVIKNIYSVQKNGQEVYTDTYHDEEQEDNDKNRWVQIPCDFEKKLILKEMDNKLEFHEVLEFGVDKFEENKQEWTFRKDEDEDDKKEENENQFEWIQSLRKGDNIDVYVLYQWMKGFIFGRDYDTFYIHIENARLYQNIEIKSIGINNLQRLQRRRNTHCKRSNASNRFEANDENLVYCGWMTAFNTKQSHSARIPILFE